MSEKPNRKGKLNPKKYWDAIISGYFKSNPKDDRKTFESRPKCDYCIENDACWENTIVNGYCCDECVPRGCSCRLYNSRSRRKFSIENFTYQTDSEGRELPCEDWHIF